MPCFRWPSWGTIHLNDSPPHSDNQRLYHIPQSLSWDQVTGDRVAHYAASPPPRFSRDAASRTNGAHYSPRHRDVHPPRGILRNAYGGTPRHVPMPPSGSPTTAPSRALSPQSHPSRASQHWDSIPPMTPRRMPSNASRQSPISSAGSVRGVQARASPRNPFAGAAIPAFQQTFVPVAPVQNFVPVQTSVVATPMHVTAPFPLAPTPYIAVTPITMPSVVHTPMSNPATPIVTAMPVPNGSSGWVPHPFPHPSVPANTFWGSNMLCGARTWPATPYNDASIVSLTGGWPLPGRASPGWSPGAWPPSPGMLVTWANLSIILCPWLIPNPTNPSVPHLVWDVTQSPITAKRITGRHVVTDLSPKFQDPATFPFVETLYIHCDVGMAKDLWGPITIERPRAVTVWDILISIYEYYQMPMSEEEVEFVSSLQEDNYERMVDACYRRCLITPSLPGFELRQGMKRVDCLGDCTLFWGLWVTYHADGSWHLNLGLIPEEGDM